MPEPIVDMPAALKNRNWDTDHDLALLFIASTRLGRILEADFVQSDPEHRLNISEYSVVAVLWLVGPGEALSPTDLSQIIIQTTSGVTKTLRRLESQGLLERLPDPNDGRGQLIRLTKKGRRNFEERHRAIFDKWADQLQSYDAGERALLADGLWNFVQFVERSLLGRVAVGGEPSVNGAKPGRSRNGATSRSNVKVRRSRM